METKLPTTGPELFRIFFQKLLDLISDELGEMFIERYLQLKQQRERFLNEQWTMHGTENDSIFREVDFEFLIMTLMKYPEISPNRVIGVQYKIAELCFKFGEVDRSYTLLRSIEESRNRLEQDSEFLGRVYLLMGRIDSKRSRWQRSRRSYAKAYEYYTEKGDRTGMAAARMSMGILSSMRWDSASGFQYFKEAENLLNGDLSGNIGLKIRVNQAIIQGMRGEAEEAAKIFERLLSHPDAQDQNFQGHLLVNQGLAHLGMNALGAARELLKRSVQAAEEIPDTNLLGIGSLALAEVLIRQKEFDEGQRRLIHAFKIFSKMHDRGALADAYRVFGLLHRDQGFLDLAAANFEISIELNAEESNLLNLCETYYEYSVLAKSKGNNIVRVQYLERSLSYAETMRAVPRIHRLQKELDALL